MNQKSLRTLITIKMMYRERESNPHGCCQPRDFKSLLSTYSNISAAKFVKKNNFQRRRADSNRRMKVLQTSPLATWVRRHKASENKNPDFVGIWLSGKRDSNSRHQPWQGCALPTELFPLVKVGTKIRLSKLVRKSFCKYFLL